MWLQREPLKSVDLLGAIVSIFDRLYSTPLLHPRAFIRSATITLLCTLLVTWYLHPLLFQVGHYVPYLRRQ